MFMTKKATVDKKISKKQSITISYQRILGKWFAFSEIKGEAYYGKIPENLIPKN